MRPRVYYCKTFQQNILFLIGWKRQKFEAFLKKNFGCGDSFENYGGACVLAKGKNGFVIVFWIESKRAKDIISHESTHAANYILDIIGHNHSYDNDEVQAYLAQEIYNEATR